MVEAILSFLNSRKVALWLLLLMMAALLLSALLPSPLTLGEEGWRSLAGERPALFWLAEHFSTPRLVTSPFFAVLAFLLFLSTLVCTALRIKGWWRSRASEFSVEKAFSFTVAGTVAAPEATLRAARELARRKGWEPADEPTEGGRVTAQKGIALSFWGSIVFHGGLLLCFLAGPVTALTGFQGDMVITEGSPLPLREAVGPPRLGETAALPAVTVWVEGLRGVYAEGRHKVDFGGVLGFDDGTAGRQAFSVNAPARFDGFQFSLQEFGFAPHVTVARGGRMVFDYDANLRHPEEGDYFPLEDDGTRLFLLFFPDFLQEGGKIGTRTQEPRNPRLLVRIVRGGESVGRKLLAPGEILAMGEYTVRFAGLGHWVNLAVSRDRGLGLLAAGFAIVTLGLLVRFLSNERRFEVVATGGNGVRLRGYSRYYPAFLEREVRGLAEELGMTIREEGDEA